jgi:hypothetical protein
MKTKKLLAFIACITLTCDINAQIKVFTGGNTIIGSTNNPVSGAKFQVAGTSVYTTATGTVTPTSAPLIQSVNAYSTAGAPDYTWSGDPNTGLFHPGPDTLAFTTGGAKRIHINPNGNIAIGNYVPKEFFQLGDRFTFHNGGTKYLGFNSYYDAGAGTNKRLVADYASTIAFGGGDIVFNVATTSTAGSAIAFTEAMRVKNDGKIGIGNNAPGYKLDVSDGDVNIPSSTSYGYRIGGNIILTQRNITSDLFIGNGAGNSNTASAITAAGYKALYNNTSGTSNNAFGAYALYSNITGVANLALGDCTLYSLTSSYNIAIGSLSQKTSNGSYNSSLGYKSLYSNTSGSYNTSIGHQTLLKNTQSNNTAVGYIALTNATADYNTAIGAYALYLTTTGNQNTAIGYSVFLSLLPTTNHAKPKKALYSCIVSFYSVLQSLFCHRLLMQVCHICCFGHGLSSR